MTKQYTLGQLIDELENCNPEWGVEFDFGSAVPTVFGSWRGSYDQLELNYKLTGYDSTEPDAQAYPNVKVRDFLEICRGAVGAVYQGWKGGDYMMSRDNLVWVSNPGNASHSGLSDIVLDDTYDVVVLGTERFDY